MSFFLNYDPSSVIVSLGGVDVQGFVDGTFIEVERSEDAFKKTAGATGDIVRTRINDRSGKITMTLLSASPSNDDMFGLYLLDEADGLSPVSIQIKDTHGNMVCHAKEAWIMKLPKIERGGKDQSNTVWVLECADIDITPGGNLV